MKNVFACPHCDAVLNPNVKVVLQMTFGDRKGLILLSPQPGNFKFICDESLRDAIKLGSLIEFNCPVCGADLTSRETDKLAELNLVTPGGNLRQVRFSRVYGTYATFVIDGDDVTSYGADAGEFSATNFFGA